MVKQPTRDTVEVVGTTPIQANRWYHVALTVNGSQMVVFLHDTVTGGRTFEGSAACSGLYQGNSSWTIGCGQYNGGTVDHMSGQIDEVRFSNAALPYGSLLQATPGTTGPVITARSMSAFERVPETTAEGYQVLYSLDLPVNAGWQGSNTIPYLVNNAASQGSFDRVAYYLELINGANVQWVYASMDAFTNSPQQLGIPHSSFNPVKFQQSVINMNVWSNVAGIVTGQSLDGGAIEMWPSNSDTGRGGLFYAGDGGTYDWDDANGTTDAGYGSFHISNPIARQMLFSYNHWGASDGAADDIGIGNASSGNPNYTFAANTGFSENGEVENTQIHIQLKSTDTMKYTADKQFFACDVSKRDLELWCFSDITVILVLYDAQKEIAYYMDVLEFYKKDGIDLDKIRKFVRLKIPVKDIWTPEAAIKLRHVKNQFS